MRVGCLGVSPLILLAALAAQAADPNPAQDPDAGSYVARDRRLAQDPFLRPYVAKMKKLTAAETLEKIGRIAEKDLALLHFDYGMAIRNLWLWGDRDPALVQFFRAKGVDHPDGMSMVLIRALWQDLNQTGRNTRE